MLSEETLRGALAAAGLDAPVRWDDVTDSTNRTAMELARGGAPAWTLVAAGHQTAGRGRAGRTWIDRPGEAVMLSVVLRPALDAGALGLVSLATGVAMAEAISEVAGVDVRCKWPNDLRVDGAKVGGILAESELDDGAVRHVVVGIGLNVDPPAGIEGAGGIGEVDRAALVTAFLRRLATLLGGDPPAIVEAWRSRSDTLGRGVEATTVDGEVVRGTAEDVDPTGALVIGTPDGRVRVASGDVIHLRPAAG